MRDKEVLYNLKEYLQSKIDRGETKIFYNELDHDEKIVDCISAIDNSIKEIERLNNIINELEKWFEKQYLDTGKCLEYARIDHNYEDVKKYTRDFNLYQMCIEKLQKLKEGK